MKTKEEAIRAFVAAGFPLIPLRGKKPYEENWEQTPVGAHTVEELIKNGNYGVVLGPEDLVIDYDPRNVVDGDKPLERLRQAIGGIPEGALVVRTGGGGLHIFLRKPRDLAVRNSLPSQFGRGLEFKAGPGRQVVGIGSIHPDTHEVYRHLQGAADSIPQAPQTLLDLIRRPNGSQLVGQEGTGGYKDDEATQTRCTRWLKEAEPAIQGFGGDAHTFKIAARLRDEGVSPKVAYDLLSQHFNPRCAPPWDEDELTTKVQNAYSYARGAVGAKHPEAVFDTIDRVKVEHDASTARPIEADDEDDKISKSGWQMNNKKEITSCFQNLLNYLSIPQAGLRGVFGYNEFGRRVELIKRTPWGSEAGLPVTDVDLQRMRAHLARNHGYEAQKGDIVDAMVDVAHRRRFHPVKAYLGSLRWDGKKRLNDWLMQYLGAEDDGEGYVAAVGRKTLVAAVARIYEPGCKFDHVLVLEGRQNLGKSGAIKVLAGEWFSDFKMDVDNKDTVQMMQGKWIVEMPELHAVRQADLDTLKAFLTREIDEARFAYGRLPGRYPRQGIFIATYNPGPDGTYLKDEENRRWWPVACNAVASSPGGRHFDFAGLKSVRDQLWAEAVELYRKGEKLTMDTETLQDAATEQQARRRADHPWRERIQDWITEQDKNEATRQEFLTCREVYIGAMGGVDVRYGRREQLGTAEALRACGWTNGFHEGTRGFWRPGAGQKRGRPPSSTNGDKKGLDIFSDIL